MNGLNLKFRPRDYSSVQCVMDFDKNVQILDGKVEVETLLPILSLTGHHADPLTLLPMLSESNSRLIGQLLQEIPTVKQPDMTDEMRLQFLPARLASGDYGSDDKIRGILVDLAGPLFNLPKDVVETVLDSSVGDVDSGNSDGSKSD